MPAVPRESLMKYVGPPLRDNIADLLGPDRVDEGVQHYKTCYTDMRVGITENRVYDGVVPLLEALVKAEKTLFVATSKHIGPTREIVEHFGLTPFFKTVHGSRAGGHLGDKGELIAMIMREEGLDPASTLMVGDTPFDVIGAKKNNIPCIGALWGYGSRAELEEAGARAVASSPLELGDLLVG